jgi:hypothetical protein
MLDERGENFKTTTVEEGPLVLKQETKVTFLYREGQLPLPGTAGSRLAASIVSNPLAWPWENSGILR